MVDSDVRPGFNLDSTFKGHLSTIRGLLRNQHNGQFVSYDDKTLKSWTVDRHGTTNVIKSVTFPGYQSTFVTSLCMGQDINMMFAACLDSNLRIYDDKLTLKSCMPWHTGLVRECLYNVRRQELITASSLGVKVCAAEHED